MEAPENEARATRRRAVGPLPGLSLEESEATPGSADCLALNPSEGDWGGDPMTRKIELKAITAFGRDWRSAGKID